MHPELFTIPFLNISVKSYGTMMVIGFLASVWLMRRMMNRMGQNPEWITNIAMYALLWGIAGARVFYVVHHNDVFRSRPLEIFAVWQGGLELLGGVLTAIAFLGFYLRRRKLPIVLYLDVLAVGLMVGLGFGRIGCFLNGCCYGKVTDVPWAVRFPYGSPAFYGQIQPDPSRGRSQPHMELPDSYFQDGYLKPLALLTPEQKQAISDGAVCSLPVHPTQIYSSINAFLIAGILYALWMKFAESRPGIVMSLMLVFYGITRIFLESLRDDNPFEYNWWAVYKGGTVSQNICIYLILTGIILLIYFITRTPTRLKTHR
ncbi:MAG TPA: prolipoprotein diacylglyceryl transferase [Anaerohalosphaeraceae bacterium]|nr:prolipoprotein diacylglyceryl transferase [Phycisphaerae bacterium]HOK95999.1 prolipoprotein diacylglyceryl transferase [Anaerohalosphaeraceae bacterium]HOM74962.1 prolipoprotein diacylglyceryl transferase [Anaerohalosphaeraceae bacterium]HPC63214.1 prolipoprotein diacylglyceryl transferase [Anaerohalosphaeraceae bacterium]HPO69267.1 prolipoprotein diacylglyceryl transferase [Anaerohalosphaeraceae bacterium]